MPHVMIIEDDALVRKLLEKRLQLAGWEVTALRDGKDIGQYLDRTAVDLILVDLGLPYMDGLSLVESLRAQGVITPILVLTAYEMPHLFATARSTGANDLVRKPYDPEVLVERIKQLLAA